MQAYWNAMFLLGYLFLVHQIIRLKREIRTIKTAQRDLGAF